MSLFSFKKKPTLSFVFDIRDSSVTLAAAKLAKGEKPELVLCQNFPIQIEDAQDHAKYLAAMLGTLDLAILSVRKSLIKIGNTEKIGEHFFFLGSPWSISEAKSIKVTKDRPFEINNAFLEKIVTEKETESGKELGQSPAANNWRVLEERIIRSKLNGYALENIFGKRTSDFEMELFVSFIPYEIKNKIYSLVDAKAGKGALRHAGSSMLASYALLKDAYSQLNNFIAVDMGDFVTDMFVVRDGVIAGVASFPSGEKDIMRSAAERTKLPEHVVSSAVRIHRAGNYDSAPKADLEKHIGAGIDAWSAKLAESLGKLCTQFDIPKNILVLPKSELSSFIVGQIIAKENKLKILNTEMDMRIADEQQIDDRIINGKAFANEPHVKMDLVLLAKGLR